ncbi:MAG: 2-oxoacid:acceptor oxidoreductase family protein [Dehalococcoidales bacterium]
MRTEIRLAGFGGQGLVLAGIVLARAAVMYAGMEAVQRQSYGTEARGGASRSEVIISDQVIDYPGVVSGRNDVLVAMGGAALTRYLKDVKPGGMVIYDPDLILDVPKDVDVKFYGIRAAKLAENIGTRIVANIVMIGALTELTGVLPLDAVKKAIASTVKAGTEELNLKAVDAGVAEAKSLAGKVTKEV